MKPTNKRAPLWEKDGGLSNAVCTIFSRGEKGTEYNHDSHRIPRPRFWWPRLAGVPPHLHQTAHSLPQHGPSFPATPLKRWGLLPQRAPCGGKPNDFSVGPRGLDLEGGSWKLVPCSRREMSLPRIQIQAGASAAGASAPASLTMNQRCFRRVQGLRLPRGIPELVQ